MASQKTKTAVLGEFFKLLDEKPADKITVSELCERCGISRNTFYYHFSDMEALFDFLAQEASDHLRSQSENYESCSDPEKIMEDFQQMLLFAKAHLHAIENIWHSDFRDVMMPRLHNDVEQYLECVVRSKARDARLADCDRELIAFLLACLVDGFIYDLINDSERGLEGKIDRACELLDGVTAHMISNAAS